MRTLGHFTLLVTRFHLSQAMAVRLNVHKAHVVILTPETAGVFGLCAVAIPAVRMFQPRRNHGCYPVHAVRNSLPCGRHLLAPLTAFEG